MGAAAPTPPHAVNPEQALLHQALLAAAAGLVREQDPVKVLQSACDSLAAASAHVRVAWVTTVEAHGGALRLVYAAGKGASPSLSRARTPAEMARALRRPKGLRGSEQMVCFPLPGEPRPCFGIFVDHSDYVDRVGLEPFLVFAEVVGGLLEQARLRDHLRRLSEFDSLTDVYNRAAMQSALDHQHHFAARRGGAYSLVMFDIDHFKRLNDQHGHGVGDQVLCDVARRACSAVRLGDWFGRWGGEEFLALLPGAEFDEAERIAERVRERVAAEPVQADGMAFPVTISAGLACYPIDGSDTRSLLVAADVALYEAKAAGRNRVHRASRKGMRQTAVAGFIEDAISNGRLRPAYQPILDLQSGALVGEELLARLLRPEGQVLVAEEFIEVATLRHLVHRVDFAMFKAALSHCRQMARSAPERLLFVNISAGLLRRAELLDALIKLVEREREQCLEHRRRHPLVLEITERDFLDTREARKMLAPFLDLGVRLAIDDFGSGYSSFEYLAHLPIDYLKIEGSLVRRAQAHRKGRSILRGIQDIADELGLITLAEGVEDAATGEVLRELGINWVQGYHYGRPELQR